MDRILTLKILIPTGIVAAVLPYILPTAVFGYVLLANTAFMALGAGWSLLFRKQRTRLPIGLITLAGFVMCGMNLDWALRGGATGPAGSVAASVSSCIFVAAGAAVLAARRPKHYREGVLDCIAALIGLGAVRWQWSGASELSQLTEVVETVMAISGVILFAGLLAVIWRLLFDKQQNQTVIRAMIGANIGQGISAFVTSSWSDPSAPMWPYSLSMVISWWAVGAFVHSDFPRLVEPEPDYERRLNLLRWLGPTSALIVSPAITIALVVRHEAPSIPVAIASALLTLVVILRIGRLLREREIGRKELAQREQRFRSLVEHGSDIIAITDRRGVVTYLSGGVEDLMGVAPEELLGTSVADVVAEEYRDAVMRRLSSLEATDAGPGRDIRLQRLDDQVRWISVRASNHFDTPGIEGWVLNIHDSTDRKLAEQALSQMALYDSLTGLPNRAYLRDSLDRTLAASPGRTALLFCDLDGFKQVNDVLGHEVGDEVLRAVTGRWSALLRAQDTLGRWGGDEFLVICPGMPSADAAEAVAQRLLDALNQPLQLSTGSVRLGCSIGLTLHQVNESTDNFVRRADSAMYVAKRASAGLQIS